MLQPIRKDLEPAGKMLAVRIKQHHRHGRSSITGHHLDEFAGFEVALHVISRDLDEAEAGKAAGDVSADEGALQARLTSDAGLNKPPVPSDTRAIGPIAAGARDATTAGRSSGAEGDRGANCGPTKS